MGNLIRYFPCEDPSSPTLLLDAHLDEIGMLVTGQDGDYLRFMTVGGVDPRMLPGREVRLLTDPVTVGLVCTPGGAEDDKAYDASELRIDIGVSGDPLAVVPAGTYGVYEESGYLLGEHRFCGKALDDRSCYLMLLEAMKLAPADQRAVNVIVLGSVKEETGGEGAMTAAYRLKPDWCIAVDVTHGSTPDGPDRGTFPLGEGAAIGIGPSMDKTLTNLMKRCAEEEQLPYHMEVMSGNTGTNGWELQVSREGIPTGNFALPLRYMHTPVEVIDLRDFDTCVKILAKVICTLGREAEA